MKVHRTFLWRVKGERNRGGHDREEYQIAKWPTSKVDFSPFNKSKPSKEEVHVRESPLKTTTSEETLADCYSLWSENITTESYFVASDGLVLQHLLGRETNEGGGGQWRV